MLDTSFVILLEPRNFYFLVIVVTTVFPLDVYELTKVVVCFVVVGLVLELVLLVVLL